MLHYTFFNIGRQAEKTLIQMLASIQRLTIRRLVVLHWLS